MMPRNILYKLGRGHLTHLLAKLRYATAARNFKLDPERVKEKSKYLITLSLGGIIPAIYELCNRNFSIR